MTGFRFGNVDIECVELVNALNSLEGISVRSSESGDGEYPFLVFFEMDTTKSGARVLSRCMSGRYSSYRVNESREDPTFRVLLADTERDTVFLLKGKPMTCGYISVKRLVANIKMNKLSPLFYDKP